MPLTEELGSGRWLFRWRTYLPLGMSAVVFASFPYFDYPFGSPLLDHVWECVCLLVGAIGLIIRGMTAAYLPRDTSARNTTQQMAERLNTTGMYSIVRNPLYLGNCCLGLAAALFLRVWWVPLIYLLAFMLYYERIIFAEEMFLRQKFGQEYMRWASRTPVFLPNLSLWQKPALPFSFRTLIRREYQTAVTLVVVLFVMEQLTELYLEHRWHVDTMRKYILGFSACGFVIIRFVHKKTTLLRVDGR